MRLAISTWSSPYVGLDARGRAFRKGLVGNVLRQFFTMHTSKKKFSDFLFHIAIT